MNSKCCHNRRKSICKDCKGSQICKHNRRKSNCIECQGSNICQHKRQKRNCRDCKGSNICQHNRRKDMCYECGYKPKKCIHNKERTKCIEYVEIVVVVLFVFII